MESILEGQGLAGSIEEDLESENWEVKISFANYVECCIIKCLIVHSNQIHFM